MSIFRFPLLVWLGIGTLIISLGIRQSFGIFMMPISEHFGTGREFFSFAIALQNLLFGVFQPFVGMAADKWGARKIIIAGACAYGLGLLLTSVTTESSMLYVSLGALIGLGLSATSYVIVLGAVAKVVPAEHAAKAFGLTTAAGSFGMFAVIPGAQYMLNEYNWQTAMQVFALLTCFMISFALFMRAPKPQASASIQAQNEDSQTLKEALTEAFSHKGYWLIHAGFLFVAFTLCLLPLTYPVI